VSVWVGRCGYGEDSYTCRYSYAALVPAIGGQVCAENRFSDAEAYVIGSWRQGQGQGQGLEGGGEIGVKALSAAAAEQAQASP